MKNELQSRDFLKKSAAGIAGIMVLPSSDIGKGLSGHTAPSDKLNIAALGKGAWGLPTSNT